MCNFGAGNFTRGWCSAGKDVALGGKRPPCCTERSIVSSWRNPDQGPGRAQQGAGKVAGYAGTGTFTTTCWSPGGQQRWQCHPRMKVLRMKAAWGQAASTSLAAAQPMRVPSGATEHPGAGTGTCYGSSVPAGIKPSINTSPQSYICVTELSASIAGLCHCPS